MTEPDFYGWTGPFTPPTPAARVAREAARVAREFGIVPRSHQSDTERLARVQATLDAAIRERDMLRAKLTNAPQRLRGALTVLGVAEEPGDGSIICYEDDNGALVVWIRTDLGEKRRVFNPGLCRDECEPGDWWQAGRDSDRPTTLHEILGYDDTPGDRRTRTFQLLFTVDDVLGALRAVLA